MWFSKIPRYFVASIMPSTRTMGPTMTRENILNMHQKMTSKLENGKAAFTPHHPRSTAVLRCWDLVLSLLACANRPTDVSNAVRRKEIELRFVAEMHFC